MSGKMEASRNDVVFDNDSSIECDDLPAIINEHVHPVSSGFFASKVRGMMEWMASLPLGQVIFKSVDRVLWCIERILIWQNPDKVSLVPMDRPVNVFLAYPLAAFLWILQHLMYASVETSSATELIKCVQTQRRRLRSVRFHGIRNMRAQHVLVRPDTVSLFYQIFWFLGKTPSSSKLQTNVESGEKEEEAIGEKIDESEHNKKRRYSALSLSADECPVRFDIDYNSESDTDYMPEHSLSSGSLDSDFSSLEEDEIEDGNSTGSDQDDESTEKTISHQTLTN